jgi:hypothetical protein
VTELWGLEANFGITEQPILTSGEHLRVPAKSLPRQRRRSEEGRGKKEGRRRQLSHLGSKDYPFRANLSRFNKEGERVNEHEHEYGRSEEPRQF